MRVTHIIPVMDPATGGPPAVVAALAAHLPATGVEPAIVCYDGWPGDGSRQRVDALLAALAHGQPPVPTYLPPLTAVEVATARTARTRLPQLFAHTRLVHIHGIWDPICLAAAAAARTLGIPYLLSTHGMLEPWAVEGQGRLPTLKKRLRWHLGWGEMLRHAAAIHDYRPGPVTVLGHTLSTPVEVIPNGIPAPTPAPPDPSSPAADRAWEELCQKYPGLAEGPVVLSLGRLSAQKGTDLLLAAWAGVRRQHPHAVLLLAGADYGMGRLARRSAGGSGGAGGVGGVVVPGPLLGPDKAAALRHAAAFVLPSRHEGFSVAVLEAMAAGLPCVLSEACHFPQAAAAGAALTVPVGDVPALADALRHVLADPDRTHMGVRGRELVLAHYTWPDIARRYAALYRRLTAA